ncbi:MAG: RNA polymerase sigma factor [Thermoanaerobaculia bacterium]
MPIDTPSLDEPDGTVSPVACLDTVVEATQSQDAFGDVYRLYARLMRLIAIRDYRVPYADSEAIVHDIFTRYFTHPEVVRGELKPYFRGAVRNECMEYWRKQRREQNIFCDVEEAESGTTGDDSLVSDAIALRLAVAETLARLRPRCRDALRCFHYEGKSMRDVAAELDVAPLYVRQLLLHCRRAARAIFESITRVAL